MTKDLNLGRLQERSPGWAGQGSQSRCPQLPPAMCQPSVLVTRPGQPSPECPAPPCQLRVISRYIIPATSQRCYLPSGAGQAFPMNVLSIKKAHFSANSNCLYLKYILLEEKKIHKIKLLVFVKQNTSVFFWNNALVFEVRTIFIYRKNLKEWKT